MSIGAAQRARDESEDPAHPDLTQLLIEEALVTEAQVERARRIAEHLDSQRTPAEVLVETGQVARAEYERIQRLFRSRLTVLQILHMEGSLTDEKLQQFQTARATQPAASERALLVDSGLVSEEAYLRAVCDHHSLPYVQPEPGLVDTRLLARASLPYLTRHRILPVQISEQTLTVIMADPLNQSLIQELERIYGVPVKPCASSGELIADALQTLKRVREGKPMTASTALQYRELQPDKDDAANPEGAVGILDYLLLKAIQSRASDLHIEPFQDRVRVRIRVDGVLHPLTELPASFGPQVTSRVKVLAGADIAERRLHQDGRMWVRTDGHEIDIRVSSYASAFGETIVMRLLDRNRGLVPLHELGFEPRMLSLLRDLVLRTSSGLVLVTGPTGSGKTTTLYSFIDYINEPGIKTITCEDPVEYVLAGVTQCGVNNKTGPTFADSLRAIVRQDPDVIVVGEIRDSLTAALAVEAALTGHKVFTTFHTEDAVGAVLRLLEMGVEPYLVASTLSCVVAQRLVRKVCPQCARPAELRREDLRFLEIDRGDYTGQRLSMGRGCPNCGGSGYRGRLGIHELLIPDDDLRDAIIRRAPSKDLRAMARHMHGFTTLQEVGLLKAAEGITTLAEVAGGAPRDATPRRLAQIRDIAGTGKFL